MKQITFFVDEKSKLIDGRSNGDETYEQVKRIYESLFSLDYIKSDYNKPMVIDFFETGGKYNGAPVYEMEFSYDGETDVDYVPSITMTEDMIKKLGLNII
jgi:hypothetical protein